MRLPKQSAPSTRDTRRRPRRRADSEIGVLPLNAEDEYVEEELEEYESDESDEPIESYDSGEHESGVD